MPLPMEFHRHLSAIGARAESGRLSAAALGLALLAAALPLPAAAQVQTQTQSQPQPAPQSTPQAAPQGAVTESRVIGDWVFRCTNNPPPPASPLPAGQTEACFITQQVLNQTNQRLVLKITVGFFYPSRQAGAILALPLGVPLAGGVKIGVDGKGVDSVPFQVCLPDSCQAFLPLNDELISVFKAGKQGVVQLTPGSGEPVNLPFSLKGFTAGFHDIK